MSIATAYQSMNYWQYNRNRDGLTLPFLCFVADVSPRELVEDFKASKGDMIRVNMCNTIGAYVTHLTPRDLVQEDNLFAPPDSPPSNWRRDGSLFWHKADFTISVDEWIADAEHRLETGKPSRVRAGDSKFIWAPMEADDKKRWLEDLAMYSSKEFDAFLYGDEDADMPHEEEDVYS